MPWSCASWGAGCAILLDVSTQQSTATQRASVLPFNASTVDKLQLDTTCSAHTGCVNRLAWNAEGTLLASVSDDRQLLLWHYPDTHQPPLAVQTGHTSNVFGVAFLPQTNDRMLVTGA